MATITVRDLPDDVRDALKAPARLHGRSMEAEVRALLAEAVVDVFRAPVDLDVDPAIWGRLPKLIAPATSERRVPLTELPRHELHTAKSIEELIEWNKGDH